jgi:hypothetical protein
LQLTKIQGIDKFASAKNIVKYTFRSGLKFILNRIFTNSKLCFFKANSFKFKQSCKVPLGGFRGKIR